MVHFPSKNLCCPLQRWLSSSNLLLERKNLVFYQELMYTQGRAPQNGISQTKRCQVYRGAFLPGTPGRMHKDPGRQKSLSFHVSLGTLFTDPPLAWAWDQDVGEASSAKPCLGVLGTASPFAPLSQSWWHLHLPWSIQGVTVTYLNSPHEVSRSIQGNGHSFSQG